MKATELLQKQHRDIEALLERLRGAGQGEDRAIRDELAAQLVAHAVSEQEHFYPVLQEILPEEIFEAIEEHGLAEFELARLLQTRSGNETSEAKSAVLAEVVMRHLRKEENDIFSAANRELGDEQQNQIGDMLAMRFRQITEGNLGKKLLNKSLLEIMPKTTGRPATAAKAPTARGAKRRATGQRAKAGQRAGQRAKAGQRAQAGQQARTARGKATQKRTTQKRTAETARGTSKGQKATTGRGQRAGQRAGSRGRATRSRA
jgi:hemerythrin-like domain-containing protein